jgi:hypothetical protein
MNILVTHKKKGNVYASIDSEDYEVVSKYNWYLDARGYACSKDKGKVLYMHIVILGKKEGYVIDHKDGNKLNNKKDNIRHLTTSQNSQNIKLDNEFIGISFLRGKYQANCSQKYLGVYKTKEEAARAYDKYVICHINKEGRLNFNYTEKEKADIIRVYYGSFEKEVKMVSNISVENYNYYRVNFDNKYVGKISKTFKTYEEALKLRNEIVSKIDSMKVKELYDLEIERNNKGQAILSVFNDNHKYEVIIDDKFWYELKPINRCIIRGRYLRLTINNKKITLHKYLMLKYGGYTEDDLKNKVIDHINRNSLDNRFENLRVLTYSDNNKNRDTNSKTGYRGIYKVGYKYQAKFTLEGKAFYSNKYDEINQAILKYNYFVLKYGKGDLLILNKLQ